MSLKMSCTYTVVWLLTVMPCWLPTAAKMNLTAFLSFICCLFGGVLSKPIARQAAPITFTSPGNPILADGSFYTADPAPLYDSDGTLYIINGHDSAPVDVNAFIIDAWQILSTKDLKEWTLHPSIGRPESIFAWAMEGFAYAAQIIKGIDQRYYLYAPVQVRDVPEGKDAFGIGVAVSSSPLGPFADAHPQGPIVSGVNNTIQNIDPTLLIDDDGRLYHYWGTFGQLRGVELDADMATFKGETVTVESLTGFFEAPWLFKRNGVYYMVYAANNAGADSPCTPTSYHACVAYGTADGPLGPWTYRGVILGIVSSTTSHPGIFQANDGQWYIVYHNRDAQGGGHFRRSVAMDRMDWDDSTSPPSIRPILQTFRPKDKVLSRNAAPLATASASVATPIQYWIKAINDLRIETTPLPPDYWSTYNGNASAPEASLTYSWDKPVDLNAIGVVFFADQAAGATIGVAPPTSWNVEYQSADGSWTAVQTSSSYSNSISDTPTVIDFGQVTTRAIRLNLRASCNDSQCAGLAVKEWQALAPTEAYSYELP